MKLNLGKGYTATIDTERDLRMGEPWKEHDGHGPVSDWENRDAEEGERVLCSDRGFKRFYDLAAAVEIAKREGWDAPPYTGTKGVCYRAVRAVERDYERLLAWCNDRWCWIGIIVTVSRDGQEVGTESLWGIESDGDYWKEEGERMARDIAETDLERRRQEWRAALTKRRELGLHFAGL